MSAVSATQVLLEGDASDSKKQGKSSTKALANVTPDKAPLLTLEGVKFKVPYKIMVGAETEASSQIKSLIKGGFEECDNVFNNWNPNSEISQINGLPSGMSFPLSEQMEEMLYLCDDLTHMTGGLFDPTVGPLMDYWKKNLSKGDVPDQDDPELIKLEKACGWQKCITLSEGSVTKNHDDTQIDLCSVSKGWTVDFIVELLTNHHYHDVYVDWGGDVRATGRRPNGKEWVASIVKPPKLGSSVNSEKILQEVPIHGQALATSGDYTQQQEGYTHIYHLKSKRPLKATKESLSSASVLASTCLLADAFATIAMLSQTLEKGEKAMKSYQKTYSKALFNYYLASRSSSEVIQGVAPPPPKSTEKQAPPKSLRIAVSLMPHTVCVLTFMPPDTVYGQDKSDRTAGAHAVTYSSVVPLGGYFSFNVLRPSRVSTLLAATSKRRLTVCIHILPHDQSEYAAMFTTSTRALKSMDSEGQIAYNKNHHTIQIADLKQAYHCEIVKVSKCGDHDLVFAKVVDHSTVTKDFSPAVYCNRKYHRVDQKKGPMQPVVIITQSSAVGRVGFYFTICSMSPCYIMFTMPHEEGKCPIGKGTFNVCLPQASLHIEADQMFETASNPFLAQFQSVGHNVIPRDKCNAIVNCELVSSELIGKAEHFLVVAKVITAEHHAVRLPLVWMNRKSCKLDVVAE